MMGLLPARSGWIHGCPRPPVREEPWPSSTTSVMTSSPPWLPRGSFPWWPEEDAGAHCRRPPVPCCTTTSVTRGCRSSSQAASHHRVQRSRSNAMTTTSMASSSGRRHRRPTPKVSTTSSQALLCPLYRPLFC